MASSHIMSHEILIWFIWEMGWSEICRFGVPGKCIGFRVQSCSISIQSPELGTPRQTSNGFCQRKLEKIARRSYHKNLHAWRSLAQNGCLCEIWQKTSIVLKQYPNIHLMYMLGMCFHWNFSYSQGILLSKESDLFTGRSYERSATYKQTTLLLNWIDSALHTYIILHLQEEFPIVPELGQFVEIAVEKVQSLGLFFVPLFVHMDLTLSRFFEPKVIVMWSFYANSGNWDNLWKFSLKSCNFWSKAEPQKKLCGDLQMSSHDFSEQH